MTETLKIALLQMTSGPDIAENLKAAEEMVREAAAQGARFILTPENTCHMRSPQSEKLKSAPVEAGHPAIGRFSSLAQEMGVWLLTGSLSIRLEGEERIANRSYLFDDTGKTVATYDKIHLFDVDLPTGETHRESDLVRPGDAAVVAQSSWGGIGLTICYDLRFPHLYRALAKAGAKILTVPAAFTVPTGQAHWETLLRARAIENGAFVLAPAQTGEHQGGRKTYGHSLAVGPWGEVLADGGDAPGIALAELNLADVDKARQSIPALRHDRPFDLKDSE
ncbi:MAG: carbon-nitrogen hydrolase family protein [Alphaproteobacteria bacterium]|nr:carbon-nitrogen hydrolase family protein [Alphaproteobacteria bacterium]